MDKSFNSCRKKQGLRQIVEIGKRITSGNPRPEYLDQISPEIIRAGLFVHQPAAWEPVLKQVLSKGDIGAGHPVINAIDEYLNSSEKEEDKKLFLENLNKNYQNPDYPEWTKNVERWLEKYSHFSEEEAKGAEVSAKTKT